MGESIDEFFAAGLLGGQASADAATQRGQLLTPRLLDETDSAVRSAKGAVYTLKAIDFVAALPMTCLSKLDKKAIRAGFWQGQGRSAH